MCELCQEKMSTTPHGLCDECDAFERNFDIDQFEADKRQRIAEENEY